MKLGLKDILAVVLGLVALAGLAVMLNAEMHVVPGDVFNYEHYKSVVLPGLRQYAGAFGAILLAVSVAYVLLGHENDVETRP
jgi:hypothetical protein